MPKSEERAKLSLTNVSKNDIYKYRRFKRETSKKKHSYKEEEFEMNKTELVAAMADQAGLSKKDAEKALKAFTDVVSAELKKDGKVQLVGFGTFEVSKRAAREGRNPQSGAVMKIAASKAPKFKAGKALKDLINA
ncbi:MAG: HU family DNA-binding protein [Lachnospiraceae bacterium]|nr:HU family DNA-binding protein [Lachnospiraceae bacterium]